MRDLCMINADKQTYLTQTGPRIMNGHPAQHPHKEGQGLQENSALVGMHQILENTNHSWVYAKSQLPTVGDFPTILGDKLLKINKICRRRNSTGELIKE
jgi:hypothetical protein